MESNLVNIDIDGLQYCKFKKGDTVSKEELLIEINRLKRLKTIQVNTNLSYKKLLNSTYGVFGFHKFILYNRLVAESIAVQSNHVIRYTIAFFNRYFRMRWHKLSDVHKALGITSVTPIDFDVVQYADTDSVMIQYGRIISYTDYKGSLENFIFTINEMDLNKSVQAMLVKYVDTYNGYQMKPFGEPSMDLAFEQILWNGLWTNKKRYVKNVAWADGNSFDPMTKIEVKGLEINKASVPKFVRGLLKDTVYEILRMGDNVNMRSLVNYIKGIKTKFELAPINEISITQRINHYEKYVISDKDDKLEFIKGTPAHVKACAVYNNALYLAPPNIKSKYSRINSGTKVQWYYSNDPRSEVFAYPSGDTPYDLAYSVDINKQFDALYLSSINKIITAIGFEPLTVGLVLFEPLW